jgi:transposase-like protein
MEATKSPFQRRYPPEMGERAVCMVREVIAESGERVGAVTRVARQLGIGPESVRNWVKQADIEGCRSPRPLGQAVTATIRPPVARNTRVSV